MEALGFEPKSKNLPANAGVAGGVVLSLGEKDPLEEEMATRSSFLAWRIPCTEDLVGYSPWSHKESDITEQLSLSLDKNITYIRPRPWL